MTLAHNDIIVILSDGLPERFNRDGDMFGEERITDLLRQNAHQTPQMMIEQFVKVSDEWAEGRAADDDMTFVVLRFT